MSPVDIRALLDALATRSIGLELIGDRIRVLGDITPTERKAIVEAKPRLREVLAEDFLRVTFGIPDGALPADLRVVLCHLALERDAFTSDELMAYRESVARHISSDASSPWLAQALAVEDTLGARHGGRGKMPAGLKQERSRSRQDIKRLSRRRTLKVER